MSTRLIGSPWRMLALLALAAASLTLVAPTAAGQTPGTTPGRVVSTGSMAVARAAHSATLLPNGKVLIAGGCTIDGCNLDEEGATAELYDPASRSFSPAGRMLIPRVGHAAVLLPSGQVLIVGGWDENDVVASAELYDPVGDTFRPAGSMSTPRAAVTVTLLLNGKVLVAGGYDGSRFLASAELYDPLTNAFAPTGSLSGPRGTHAGALLRDGRVMIAGGESGGGVILSSAELYDPLAGTFSQSGEMGVIRYKLAATPLSDGRVLVTGGSDDQDWYGRYATAEVFDPATGTFAPTAEMAVPRYKLGDAVVPLPTGEVLVAGDAERVEVFDPAAGVFRTVEGRLDAARMFSTATALPDGSALIVGGYDNEIRVTAGAWLYQPTG